MFENILRQPVIERLREDIASVSLAPAMLFSGPEYGGKGTAALELARVLSCEDGEPGRWNCGCPGCARHRMLLSADILLLGRRRFFEEISAASGAFLRFCEDGAPDAKSAAAVRMLFVRAVRKLLARFNPVLWEDDPGLGKIRPAINALEEELEDFERLAGTPLPRADAEKICGGVLKRAAKLESEGMGDFIPIAQIRRASWWSRLAPVGKHKCIVIENAEHMKDEAKNSLLKILEEPPPRVTIVITSSRPMSLLPTMLSRLREYRFARRSAAAEAEVISRIFREPAAETAGGIENYLASFLPVRGEILYPLGAWFTASAAAEAVRELRRLRREIPAELADLGKFAAPIAESGGMGRPAADSKSAVAAVLKTAGGFEAPGLLARFFKNIGALFSAWLRAEPGSPEKSARADFWRRELNRSLVESETYNISAALVLERLLETLARGMCA